MSRLLPLFCAVLAMTQNAAAQTLGQGYDDGISMWRVGLSILLCAAVALAGAFVLRTKLGHAPFPIRFAGGKRRRLQLVESVKLGPNSGVSIVSCDGRELLILVSPEGGKVIEELPQRRAAVECHEAA
jgi:hypothetical protein